jgi:hypothetical protein
MTIPEEEGVEMTENVQVCPNLIIEFIISINLRRAIPK